MLMLDRTNHRVVLTDRGNYTSDNNLVVIK